MDKFDEQAFRQWRGKFSEDNFIDDDIQSNTYQFNGTKQRPKLDYKDYELENEIERRRLFDLQRKLKEQCVNKTKARSVYSHQQSTFIRYIPNVSDWQRIIFDKDKRPHLIRAINYNPKHLFPEVANGHVGIQGFNDEIQIQSVFSGAGMTTHRAAIPSWTIANISTVFTDSERELILGRSLELDISTATLTQILHMNDFVVEQRIYAHQTLTSLVVHEIEIEFHKTITKTVHIILPKLMKNSLSHNIQFQQVTSGLTYAKLMVGETQSIGNVPHTIYAYFNEIPEKIVISPGDKVQKHYFLLSINENQDTAKKDFVTGSKLIEDGNKLFSIHSSAWRNIWSRNSILMVQGNDINVPLLTAQYLLMINSPSFGRRDHSGAIGTTGLGVPSNQGIGHSLTMNCGGRIEFFQELMVLGYHSIMNPVSTRSVLKRRIEQLNAAIENAKHFGYEGARYPAVTNSLGEELCPADDCKFLHFPTGLVALATKRFLMASGEESFFREDSTWKMLYEINRFYLRLLNDSNFDFKQLKSNGPNDIDKTFTGSIFNAGLIKEVLLIISSLNHYFDIVSNDTVTNYMLRLHNITEKLQLPHDSILQYNPPFNGFHYHTEKVSLPEGIMLRYPLDGMLDIDSGIRNTKVYENKLHTPKNQLALSYLLIGEMEAGLFTKAWKYFNEFNRFHDNQFHVWTNNSKMWNGSYVPSASSFVDSVLFGICGVRILKTGLYINPTLIGNITYIELSSIHYLNSAIKVILSEKSIFLKLVARTSRAPKLGVKLYDEESFKLLQTTLSFPLKRIVIKRLK